MVRDLEPEAQGSGPEILHNEAFGQVRLELRYFGHVRASDEKIIDVERNIDERCG